MNKVELSPVEAARFCRKVRIDEHGCWLWTGCLNSKGYSCLGVRKQMWLGHRLTYSVAHGPIADGLVIDHLCQVRRCVNPAHLEAVTVAENNRRAMFGPAVDATHALRFRSYEEQMLRRIRERRAA